MKRLTATDYLWVLPADRKYLVRDASSLG